MPKKTIPLETANDARRDASFDRRVALRGLGVLVAAPVIAACREDRAGMSALDGGGTGGSGGAGSGGAGGAGGAAVTDAGIEMPPSPMSGGLGPPALSAGDLRPL